MLRKRYLSLNAMDKLLRQAGADRVSDDAKEALAELLEQKAQEIAQVAKKMAMHAGRKTITARDISLATK